MFSPSQRAKWVAVSLLVLFTSQLLGTLHVGHNHGQADTGGNCTICNYLASAAIVERDSPPLPLATRTGEVVVVVPSVASPLLQLFPIGPRSPPAGNSR